MSDIEDTSKRPKVEHLAGLLGNGQHIENLEAAGQQQVLTSRMLPKDMMGGRKVFEDLGFVFWESFVEDDLFVRADLPPGWSRQGSDHNMWSYIIDGNGTRRVAVFYKAAPYDRRAFMRIEDVDA